MLDPTTSTSPSRHSTSSSACAQSCPYPTTVVSPCGCHRQVRHLPQRVLLRLLGVRAPTRRRPRPRRGSRPRRSGWCGPHGEGGDPQRRADLRRHPAGRDDQVGRARCAAERGGHPGDDRVGDGSGTRAGRGPAGAASCAAATRRRCPPSRGRARRPMTSRPRSCWRRVGWPPRAAPPAPTGRARRRSRPAESAGQPARAWSNVSCASRSRYSWYSASIRPTPGRPGRRHDRRRRPVRPPSSGPASGRRRCSAVGSRSSGAHRRQDAHRGPT